MSLPAPISAAILILVLVVSTDSQDQSGDYSDIRQELRRKLEPLFQKVGSVVELDEKIRRLQENDVPSGTGNEDVQPTFRSASSDQPATFRSADEASTPAKKENEPFFRSMFEKGMYSLVGSQQDPNRRQPRIKEKRLVRLLTDFLNVPRFFQGARTNIWSKILLKEFFQYGLDAFIQDPMESLQWAADSGRMFTYAPIANVVAYLPGKNVGTTSDQIIAITGHYDTHPNRTGLNDNASGISVMLEIARTLTESECEFDNTVMFVQLDQEEIGLLGSGYFVERFLVPKMIAERANFQGAYNLDTIMNYNSAPHSQRIPDGIKKFAPELVEKIKKTNFKGDFMLIQGRRGLDDRLGQALINNWRKLEKPKFKMYYMSAPEEKVTKEEFQELFKRGDHWSFWKPDPKIYNGTFSAVEVADTGKSRSVTSACYHALCDKKEKARRDPKHIFFIQKLADALIGAIMDLANGTCSNAKPIYEPVINIRSSRNNQGKKLVVVSPKPSEDEGFMLDSLAEKSDDFVPLGSEAFPIHEEKMSNGMTGFHDGLRVFKQRSPRLQTTIPSSDRVKEHNDDSTSNPYKTVEIVTNKTYGRPEIFSARISNPNFDPPFKSATIPLPKFWNRRTTRSTPVIGNHQGTIFPVFWNIGPMFSGQREHVKEPIIKRHIRYQPSGIMTDFVPDQVYQNPQAGNDDGQFMNFGSPNMEDQENFLRPVESLSRRNNLAYPVFMSARGGGRRGNGDRNRPWINNPTYLQSANGMQRDNHISPIMPRSGGTAAKEPDTRSTAKKLADAHFEKVTKEINAETPVSDALKTIAPTAELLPSSASQKTDSKEDKEKPKLMKIDYGTEENEWEQKVMNSFRNVFTQLGFEAEAPPITKPIEETPPPEESEEKPFSALPGNELGASVAKGVQNIMTEIDKSMNPMGTPSPPNMAQEKSPEKSPPESQKEAESSPEDQAEYDIPPEGQQKLDERPEDIKPPERVSQKQPVTEKPLVFDDELWKNKFLDIMQKVFDQRKSPSETEKEKKPPPEEKKKKKGSKNKPKGKGTEDDEEDEDDDEEGDDDQDDKKLAGKKSKGKKGSEPTTTKAPIKTTTTAKPSTTSSTPSSTTSSTPPSTTSTAKSTTVQETIPPPKTTVPPKEALLQRLNDILTKLYPSDPITVEALKKAKDFIKKENDLDPNIDDKSLIKKFRDFVDGKTTDQKTPKNDSINAYKSHPEEGTESHPVKGTESHPEEGTDTLVGRILDKLRKKNISLVELPSSDDKTIELEAMKPYKLDDIMRKPMMQIFEHAAHKIDAHKNKPKKHPKGAPPEIAGKRKTIQYMPKTRPSYNQKPATQYNKFMPKPWDTRPTKTKIKPFYNANQLPNQKYASSAGPASTSYDYPTLLKYKDIKPKKYMPKSGQTKPQYKDNFNQIPKPKLAAHEKFPPKSQQNIDLKKNYAYPPPRESNAFYGTPPSEDDEIGGPEESNFIPPERPLTPSMFPKNNRYNAPLQNDVKLIKEKIKNMLNSNVPSGIDDNKLQRQHPKYKKEYIPYKHVGKQPPHYKKEYPHFQHVGKQPISPSIRGFGVPPERRPNVEENFPPMKQSPSMAENYLRLPGLPGGAAVQQPQINRQRIFNPLEKSNPLMKQVEKQIADTKKQIDDTAKEIQDSIGGAFPFKNMTIPKIFPPEKPVDYYNPRFKNRNFQNVIPKIHPPANMPKFSNKPEDYFNPRYRNLNLIPPNKNQISSAFPRKEPTQIDANIPGAINPRFLLQNRGRLSNPTRPLMKPAEEGKQRGRNPSENLPPGGSTSDSPWAKNPRYKYAGKKPQFSQPREPISKPQHPKSVTKPSGASDLPFKFNPRFKMPGMKTKPGNQVQKSPYGSPQSPWPINPEHKMQGMIHGPFAAMKPGAPREQQKFSPEANPSSPGSPSKSPLLFKPRQKQGGKSRLGPPKQQKPESGRKQQKLRPESPLLFNPRYKPMPKQDFNFEFSTSSHSTSDSPRQKPGGMRRLPDSTPKTMDKHQPPSGVGSPGSPGFKIPPPRQYISPAIKKVTMKKTMGPTNQIFKEPLPDMNMLKGRKGQKKTDGPPRVRTSPPVTANKHYFNPLTQRLRNPKNIQTQPQLYSGKKFKQQFPMMPGLKNNWLPNNDLDDPLKMANDLNPVINAWSVKTPTGQKTTIKKVLKGNVKGGPLNAREKITFMHQELPGGHALAHASSSSSDWSSGGNDPLNRSGSSSSSSFSSSSSSSSSSL